MFNRSEGTEITSGFLFMMYKVTCTRTVMCVYMDVCVRTCRNGNKNVSCFYGRKGFCISSVVGNVQKGNLLNPFVKGFIKKT